MTTLKTADEAAVYFNSLRIYCSKDYWLVVTDEASGRWLAESVFPDAFMLRQGPGDDDQRKLLKDPNGISAVDLTVAARLANDSRPYRSPFRSGGGNPPFGRVP